jgi:hypothetical protein
VKPEFRPAVLAWFCIAAHSRIGHPQIDKGGEAAVGSVGLKWVRF